MFFSLSKHRDNRFPHHNVLGSWILSHDSGWRVKENSITKSIGALDDRLGFWTSLDCDGSTINLNHSFLRGYPLWWNQDQKLLTNLAGSGQPLWADDHVIVHEHEIETTKVDIIGDVNVVPLTKNHAIARLSDIVVKSVKYLFQNTPDCTKKHFVTGGIDTAITRACLACLDQSYESLDYEHFEYDSFTNAVKDILYEHYWAYQQIHHWRNPTILLTGSGGDEFLMRSPTTIALWCAWHNVDLMQIFSKRQGYHKEYFSRVKNLNIIDQAWKKRHFIKDHYPSHADLVQQICNINANDHQHWHLGNTFTWSPYHDLQLTKIMLSVDIDSLIDHFIDASITRDMIELIYPGNRSLIGPNKNLHARAILNES